MSFSSAIVYRVSRGVSLRRSRCAEYNWKIPSRVSPAFPNVNRTREIRLYMQSQYFAKTVKKREDKAADRESYCFHRYRDVIFNDSNDTEIDTVILVDVVD